MNAPTLTTARLTLGPATPAHAAAFSAFWATGASRFIGGPPERRDARVGAGLSALRGHGPHEPDGGHLVLCWPHPAGVKSA